MSRNFQKCLLDPEQCTVLIVDHQSQMYFGVESHPRQSVRNAVIMLAKSCKAFKVPCIYTTIAKDTFSGPVDEELMKVFPDTKLYDRTAINCWEDEPLKKAVKDTKNKKIVIAGLWTEACTLFPAVSMKEDGYDVYVVTDACGGATKEAHDMAVLRMVQAGVVPVTSEQVCLEWQRNWANAETYDAVMEICKVHGGAYGLGIQMAEKMVPAYHQ